MLLYNIIIKIIKIKNKKKSNVFCQRGVAKKQQTKENSVMGTAYPIYFIHINIKYVLNRHTSHELSNTNVST